MKDAHNQHIGVLDGLRAMAILLVLASHGLEMVWHDMSKPYMPVGPVDLAAFLKNGFLGVDLFFVLSGFLIAGQLLDAGIGAAEGRRKVVVFFLMRRAARIIPAYYLILTFATIIFMGHDPLRRGALSWAHSYAVHLLFLQNFFYTDYNPVFWSLAVEMQFYPAGAVFSDDGYADRSAGAALLERIRPDRGAGAAAHGGCVAALTQSHRILTTGSFISGWRCPFALTAFWAVFFATCCGATKKSSPFLRRPACLQYFISWRPRSFSSAGWVGAAAGERGHAVRQDVPYILRRDGFFAACCWGFCPEARAKGCFPAGLCGISRWCPTACICSHRFAIDDIFTAAGAQASFSGNHFVTYFAGFALFLAIIVFISTLIYELVEKPFIDRVKKAQA